MDKRKLGLYGKFSVTRTDGKSAPGQKHDGCDYFVLDLTHDPHAKPALLAYAESCASEYPLLARDLRDKYAASPTLSEPTACASIDAENYPCELLAGHIGPHEALRGLRSFRTWENEFFRIDSLEREPDPDFLSADPVSPAFVSLASVINEIQDQSPADLAEMAGVTEEQYGHRSSNSGGSADGDSVASPSSGVTPLPVRQRIELLEEARKAADECFWHGPVDAGLMIMRLVNELSSLTDQETTR